MEWLPVVNEVIEKVATPEPLMEAVPSVVAPSLNVTRPVAVFAPAIFGVTVAVKVTDCPATEGFAEEVNDVLVVAADELTVCATAVEVLVAK